MFELARQVASDSFWQVTKTFGDRELASGPYADWTVRVALPGPGRKRGIGWDCETKVLTMNVDRGNFQGENPSSLVEKIIGMIGDAVEAAAPSPGLTSDAPRASASR